MPRRAATRIAHYVIAGALALPAPAGSDVLQYVSTSAASTTQQLGELLLLDDGTVLAAGTTDSMAWLEGVPNSTLSVA
eukprot:COSAG05_NODE_17774_length_319_cov_0.940909_1_plen_77_part_01